MHTEFKFYTYLSVSYWFPTLFWGDINVRFTWTESKWPVKLMLLTQYTSATEIFGYRCLCAAWVQLLIKYFSLFSEGRFCKFAVKRSDSVRRYYRSDWSEKRQVIPLLVKDPRKGSEDAIIYNLIRVYPAQEKRSSHRHRVFHLKNTLPKPFAEKRKYFKLIELSGVNFLMLYSRF